MAWYIPLLIFAARICDVSIGTFRTVVLLSGMRYTSALLGFFEVVIWVLAVGGTLQYLRESWLTVVAYAGGFAAGVILGMWIEERVALGFRAVRVISPGHERDVSRTLRERGFHVTRVDGHGRDGPVEISFLVIRRSRLRALREAVREVEPNAFITIERAEAPSSKAIDTATDSRFARRFMERALPLRK